MPKKGVKYPVFSIHNTSLSPVGKSSVVRTGRSPDLRVIAFCRPSQPFRPVAASALLASYSGGTVPDLHRASLFIQGQKSSLEPVPTILNCKKIIYIINYRKTVTSRYHDRW